MARPKLIDAFPMNNELDMLECRLTELQDAVDHFIIVEATRDHQDHRKPLWYAENKARFAPWADKIVHVIVDEGEMPSKQDDANPWAREHAQRAFIGRGLTAIDGLADTDILMQSDIDEIPRALQARNVRPGGRILAFEQRLYSMAVDWLHPEMWHGTVAGQVGTVLRLQQGRQFAYMRDMRMKADCPPQLRDAGWHLSWMGGSEAALAKLGSFCHPEIAERTQTLLETNVFLTQGYHVDGQRMMPVDVDDTWPKWIVDGHAPASWFRPRP